jgi:nucleotide-binding universal stress UspA family protein
MEFAQKLLVATDFSEYGQRACEIALEWAKRVRGEVHFAHGVEHMASATTPSAEPLVATYVDQARRSAEQRLRPWESKARDLGLESDIHVIDAPVAQGVVRLASDLAMDCIVTGTHGRKGLGHFWFGSVAERIVRHAACRVLVVRGEHSPLAAGTIIVGDDLTPLGRAARRDALSIAAATDARVTMVHSLDLGIPYLSTVEVVVPNDMFDDLYTAAREQLQEDAKETPDIDIDNVVVSDRAAVELCERAEKSDAGLVVVGSHSRHGLDRVLLGSVAERVVRRVPCSVLVVRERAGDVDPG